MTTQLPATLEIKREMKLHGQNMLNSHTDLLNLGVEFNVFYITFQTIYQKNSANRFWHCDQLGL